MKPQRYQLNANGPERADVMQRAHGFIDRLPMDKSWVIEVKAFVKSRTNPQNAALFGVAYPALVEATGYTPDELHDAFCKRFFGTVRELVMGEQVIRPRRTTTTNADGERDVMPAGDFADFYAMVQMVGAEAGVDVPDPDPLHGNQRFAA